MSGLIAMLAAADELGKAQCRQAKSYRRRIVFLALAGEPWDYMGSRRLLWEMQQGSNATAGLDLDLIDQVALLCHQIESLACRRLSHDGVQPLAVAERAAGTQDSRRTWRTSERACDCCHSCMQRP